MQIQNDVTYNYFFGSIETMYDRHDSVYRLHTPNTIHNFKTIRPEFVISIPSIFRACSKFRSVQVLNYQLRIDSSRL